MCDNVETCSCAKETSKLMTRSSQKTRDIARKHRQHRDKIEEKRKGVRQAAPAVAPGRAAPVAAPRPAPARPQAAPTRPPRGPRPERRPAADGPARPAEHS